MKVDMSFLHYKKKKLDSAFQPKDILGKFIFFYFFFNYRMPQEFAHHPWAKAMIIFSMSFQFYYRYC